MAAIILPTMINSVLAADPLLQAAVDACLAESPSGNCLCNTGCGIFNTPIQSWDVKQFTDFERLLVIDLKSIEDPLLVLNT